MAAQGTVQIQGIMNGFDNNSYSVTIGQISITTVAAIGEVRSVTLASGANTINVPAGSTCMFIQPPTGNAVKLLLKGVTGDTGIAISSVNGLLLSFDNPAPASVVINAAAALSTPTKVIFI